MNSLETGGPLPSSGVGEGKDEKIWFAASLFLPTMTMLELPSVWQANERAMASPIPEVPPTKIATGLGEVRWLTMALDARTVEIEGMIVLTSKSSVNGFAFIT